MPCLNLILSIFQIRKLCIYLLPRSKNLNLEVNDLQLLGFDLFDDAYSIFQIIGTANIISIFAF